MPCPLRLVVLIFWSLANGTSRPSFLRRGHHPFHSFLNSTRFPYCCGHAAQSVAIFGDVKRITSIKGLARDEGGLRDSRVFRRHPCVSGRSTCC